MEGKKKKYVLSDFIIEGGKGRKGKRSRRNTTQYKGKKNSGKGFGQPPENNEPENWNEIGNAEKNYKRALEDLREFKSKREAKFLEDAILQQDPWGPGSNKAFSYLGQGQKR